MNPVKAVISGGNRVVSPYELFEASASHSVDPDFVKGATAPGLSSTLSFSWVFIEKARGVRVWSVTRQTSPELLVDLLKAGLKEGTVYTLELNVDAARTGVATDHASGNATASTQVTVAKGAAPAVKVKDSFPADLLFISSYPIRIRCEAKQPSNPNFADEVVFDWSAPGGEEALANISRLTLRTNYELTVFVASAMLRELEAAKGSGGEEKLQSSAKNSIMSLLDSAASSLDTTSEDGDSEASLAVVENVASMITRILDATLGDSKQEPTKALDRLEDDRIKKMMGPILNRITEIVGNNDTTKEQRIQTFATITSLSPVAVRTMPADAQETLASHLLTLLDGLDPCSDFDEVNKFVLSSSDQFAG
eukprot:tig00000215_g18591.t1